MQTVRFEIDSRSAQVVERGGITLTVERIGGVLGDLSFRVFTDGTARHLEDFWGPFVGTQWSSFGTIPAGQSSVSVSIVMVDDIRSEAPDSIHLRISDVVNSVDQAVVAPSSEGGSANIVILDNDLETLVDLPGGSPAGKLPEGILAADSDGNLFGTTSEGGAYGFGAVFKIEKTASGYATSPTTLVSFNGGNGANPIGGLILDAEGNLFGTTAAGGAHGVGTVFEIAKTANGYASMPSTLVTFDGINGSAPRGTLIADVAGNLFGTTTTGGTYGLGTVFEIAKTVNGYASTPTTLVHFDGSNGAKPYADLTVDGAGNLFGTTSGGGTYGFGTVFEIANTATGYAGAPTTLVNFAGYNGRAPMAGLTLDTAGHLFGTTSGGGEFGGGTVFTIVKNAGVYASMPTTITSFNSLSTGTAPDGRLIIDADGNLFGTTAYGRPYTPPPYSTPGHFGTFAGSVFKILKNSNGGYSAPIPLADLETNQFSYFYKNFPYGEHPKGLIVDAAGNLFGTALRSGSIDLFYANQTPSGGGTVFKIPSVVDLRVDTNVIQQVHGNADKMTVSGVGRQNVYATGLVTGTTLEGGGIQVDWGRAIDTTIKGGTQYVWGTATRATISSGTQHVGFGGTCFETRISNDGEQIVHLGGVSNAALIAGGDQAVYGSAEQTTIGDGGLQSVYGSATSTIVNGGGEQNIYVNGTATDTAVNAGGVQITWGSAVDTTINGGNQYVWGTATGTTIQSGVQHVGAGGSASDTTIDSGGLSYVHTGGTLHDVLFAGAEGTLMLDEADAFSGEISGWEDGDRLGLGDIIFGESTTLAYVANAGNTGGTLTVSGGTHVASLTLLGQYTAGDFALSSDGHGGTLVSDPGTPVQAQNVLAPSLYA